MTVNDMKTLLDKWGIPVKWYNVGGYLEGAHCLEVNDGRWIIYVGEKGKKTSVFMFLTEDDACRVLSNFLLSKLKLLSEKR